jgi:hypothetical protein
MDQCNRDFLSDTKKRGGGVSRGERTRTINGNVRQIPAVLRKLGGGAGALRSNACTAAGQLLETWGHATRRSSREHGRGCRARVIKDSDFVLGGGGGCATVRPQLEGLEVRVELRPPD